MRDHHCSNFRIFLSSPKRNPTPTSSYLWSLLAVYLLQQALCPPEFFAFLGPGDCNAAMSLVCSLSPCLLGTSHWTQGHQIYIWVFAGGVLFVKRHSRGCKVGIFLGFFFIYTWENSSYSSVCPEIQFVQKRQDKEFCLFTHWFLEHCLKMANKTFCQYTCEHRIWTYYICFDPLRSSSLLLPWLPHVWLLSLFSVASSVGATSLVLHDGSWHDQMPPAPSAPPALALSQALLQGSPALFNEDFLKWTLKSIISVFSLSSVLSVEILSVSFREDRSWVHWYFQFTFSIASKLLI